MKLQALAYGIVAMLVISCSSQDKIFTSKTGYSFGNPDVRFTLPKILNEISGQAIIDSVTFACIQDESGMLFIYDSKQNSIVKEIKFSEPGDYEGICIVQKDIFILRSDGVLFHLANYNDPNMIVTKYETGVPADNNEGLCYDSLNSRLLIGCKSKIGKGEAFDDVRAIYGFDLATKKLSDQPVFSFDVQAMIQFAEQNNIKLPKKDKKGEETTVLKFKTSALGIHPITGELYVLSAVDHALFVFNPNGEIQHLELLDAKLFNKPEGISFYQNGDVLITNEAQDKKPTLLKFLYTPVNPATPAK